MNLDSIDVLQFKTKMDDLIPILQDSFRQMIKRTFNAGMSNMFFELYVPARFLYDVVELWVQYTSKNKNIADMFWISSERATALVKREIYIDGFHIDLIPYVEPYIFFILAQANGQLLNYEQEYEYKGKIQKRWVLRASWATAKIEIEQ